MNSTARRWYSRRIIRWIAVFALVAAAAVYALRPYWSGDPDAEVTRLLGMLSLHAGMTVAEVGAGSGRMSILMAQQLGPAGRVFSTELDSKDLERIRQAAAKAGAQNVTVIQAAEKETKLAAQCCDAIFMRKVYHHFSDPAAMNSSLFQALRPGGRLAVIDFAPRPWLFWLPRVKGAPDNRGGHGIAPALLIQELTAAGFAVERQIDDWPGFNYCVVARKPA